LTQTWIVDPGSFHITPRLECFTKSDAGSHEKFYPGNNNACTIDGIGTTHLSLDNGQELVLKDVRYVPGVKKRLLFVDRWICTVTPHYLVWIMET
jgi:hypothetical protein